MDKEILTYLQPSGIDSASLCNQSQELGVGQADSGIQGSGC